jgi:hypothetical protein
VAAVLWEKSKLNDGTRLVCAPAFTAAEAGEEMGDAGAPATGLSNSEDTAGCASSSGDPEFALLGGVNPDLDRPGREKIKGPSALPVSELVRYGPRDIAGDDIGANEDARWMPWIPLSDCGGPADPIVDVGSA